MASRTPPSEVLAAWLAGQRWFGGKSRRIAAVSVEDTVPLGEAVVAVAAVVLDDGTRERYAIPLRAGAAVQDALDDPAFGRSLLDVIGRQARRPGEHGQIVGARGGAFRELPPDVAVRRLGGEQSNTSLAFGDAVILKLFRRLQDGVNPDLEIVRFLTERTAYRHTPRLAGALEYRGRDGRAATLAVAQEFVTGARDGWEWLLGRLASLYDEARRTGGPPTPERVRVAARDSLAALATLGRRTGELHLALAGDGGDPAFTPEVVTADDVTAWAEAVRRQVDAARAALGPRRLDDLPVPRAALSVLEGRLKIRHHGDFHLGQTLYRQSAGDFMIIDFEGEPVRPLAERRRKHAPVRDVAGLRRSLDYAAASARPEGVPAWAETWEREARRAFTEGYRTVTAGARFLPESPAAFEAAAAVFELEKAAYEVVYEANNRPDWIAIPTRGLLSAAATLRRAGPGAA